MRAAYSHREKLLSGNERLSIGSTAVLDASLTGGSGDIELFVTPTAIHYDVGPIPTDVVVSTAYPPDDHGWWLPEAADNKWRCWLGPRSSVDLTLFNRGIKRIATSLIENHLTLRYQDDEHLCFGMVVKMGRYWHSVPEWLLPGKNVKCTAVFDFEPSPENHFGSDYVQLALMLPWTEYHYDSADDTARWIQPRGADDYYVRTWNGDAPTGTLLDESDIQYAADWAIELPAYWSWHRVGILTGTGGIGLPGGDDIYRSARSRPFSLTGGPFKLRWTVKPYGPYTSWPYFLLDVEAVDPISYLAEPLPGVGSLVETDFYHSSSEVFDERQSGGRYVLDTAGVNCRWTVTLWQRRWHMAE